MGDQFEFESIKTDRLDDPDRPVVTAAEMEGHKATAGRLLAKILEGAEVSRLNCEELGIAPANSSIHSAASYLRNEADIPLSSSKHDGVSGYWLEPAEILAFRDPEKRKDQAEKQRRETQGRRLYHRVSSAIRLILAANDHPAIMDRYPFVLEALKTVKSKTEEILDRESRRSGATAANDGAFATDGTGGEGEE